MSGRIFFGTTKISRIFKGDNRVKRLYLPDIDKTITLAEKIDYSSPILYPYPGDEDVYEDNDLYIYLPSSTVISNLKIVIKKGTEEIETIDEAFTESNTSSSGDDNFISLQSNYSFTNNGDQSISQSGRTLNVGVQRLKFSDSANYVRIKSSKPFDSNAEYTIEVSGITLDGKDLNTYLGIDKWTFFTRSKHTIEGNEIYVSNNLNDYDADFRTLQGAFKYINENPDSTYIVTVDGTTEEPYYELLYLKNNAKVIVQAKNATYTDKSSKTNPELFTDNFKYINSSESNSLKPVIKFSNCGYLNSMMTARGLFEFDGSGTLILNNLRFINTYTRNLYHTGTDSFTYYAGEAFGMGGTGNLIARDCEFNSKQDTLMLLNKSWLYNCKIIGDVDFIWGYEGLKTALIENSYLECYLDNNRLSLENKSDTQSCIIAPRQAKDLFVGKGIVLLNDYISVDNKVKTYFGRNPWAEDFINNGAIINSNIYTNDETVTHDGTYTGPHSWFKSALWMSAGNNEGYSLLGFKDYNISQVGSSDNEIQTSAIRRYIKYVYYNTNQENTYDQINFRVNFNFNQTTANNVIFTNTSNNGKLGYALLALKDINITENDVTIEGANKLTYGDAGCKLHIYFVIPFYSISAINSFTAPTNNFSVKRNYINYDNYTQYRGSLISAINSVTYINDNPGEDYQKALNSDYYNSDANTINFNYAGEEEFDSNTTSKTYLTNPVQNVKITANKKDFVIGGYQLNYPASGTTIGITADENKVYGYNGRKVSFIRPYFVPEGANYNSGRQFWFLGKITYPTKIGETTTTDKWFIKRACNSSVSYTFSKVYTGKGDLNVEDEVDLGSDNIYSDYTLYGNKVYSEGSTDTVNNKSLDVYAGSEYLANATTQTINDVKYYRETWIKYDYADDLRCEGTAELTEQEYNNEYSTRDKILNKLFDLRNTTIKTSLDIDEWLEYNSYISTAEKRADGDEPIDISIIEFSKMNSSVTYEGKTGDLSPTYVSNYTGITYAVDATNGKFYRNKTYGVFNSGTKLIISGVSGRTLYISTYLNDYANISYTDGDNTGTFTDNPQRLSISSNTLVLNFTATTNINSIYIY